MPYIFKDRRPEIDEKLNDLLIYVALQNLEPGELNYILTRICLNWLPETYSYRDLSSVGGVLGDVKYEIRRRLLPAYENRKVLENGDLPEYSRGPATGTPQTLHHVKGTILKKEECGCIAELIPGGIVQRSTCDKHSQDVYEIGTIKIEPLPRSPDKEGGNDWKFTHATEEGTKHYSGCTNPFCGGCVD